MNKPGPKEVLFIEDDVIHRSIVKTISLMRQFDSTGNALYEGFVFD